MKNPILMILISQMGFILLLENYTFGLDRIVSLVIIDIIIFILVIKFNNNTKFTKLGILLTLKIILVFNLLNFYEAYNHKLRIFFL